MRPPCTSGRWRRKATAAWRSGSPPQPNALKSPWLCPRRGDRAAGPRSRGDEHAGLADRLLSAGEGDHRRAVARGHVPGGESQPVRVGSDTCVRPSEVGGRTGARALWVATIANPTGMTRRNAAERGDGATSARRRYAAAAVRRAGANATHDRAEARQAAPATPARIAVRSSPPRRSTATCLTPSPRRRRRPASRREGGGGAQARSQPGVGEHEQGRRSRSGARPLIKVIRHGRAGFAVEEGVVPRRRGRSGPSRPGRRPPRGDTIRAG